MHLLEVTLRSRLGTAAEPYLEALPGASDERLFALSERVAACGTKRKLLQVLAELDPEQG